MLMDGRISQPESRQRLAQVIMPEGRRLDEHESHKIFH